MPGGVGTDVVQRGVDVVDHRDRELECEVLGVPVRPGRRDDVETGRRAAPRPARPHAGAPRPPRAARRSAAAPVGRCPGGPAASPARCTPRCAAAWRWRRCRRPDPRSTEASTSTWVLPVPVSMTGTWECSTTRWIRPAPPRGISTSTRPRARISTSTPSRPCSSIPTIRSAGSPCAASTVPQHADQGGVGVQGRRAAAQHHGAAGFQGEAGGIDGDIGPCLVDHADHAHRHSHLAQLEAVVEHGATDHLADGIGQGGGVPQLLGDRRHPLDVQGEPVPEAGGHARGIGGARGHAHWQRRSPLRAPPALRPSPSAAGPWHRGAGGRAPAARPSRRGRRRGRQWSRESPWPESTRPPASREGMSDQQNRGQSITSWSRWTAGRRNRSPSCSRASSVLRPAMARSSSLLKEVEPAGDDLAVRRGDVHGDPGREGALHLERCRRASSERRLLRTACGRSLVEVHGAGAAGREAQPHQAGAAAAVLCREEGADVLPRERGGELRGGGHQRGGAGGGGELGGRELGDHTPGADLGADRSDAHPGQAGHVVHLADAARRRALEGARCTGRRRR